MKRKEVEDNEQAVDSDLYQPIREVAGLLLQHVHLLPQQEVLSPQSLKWKHMCDAKCREWLGRKVH